MREGVTESPQMPRSPSSPSADQRASRPTRKVAVLGATGSIGTATIDVLEHLNSVDPESGWHAWAISAHRNASNLKRIAESLATPPARLIVSDPRAAAGTPELSAGDALRVGEQALVEAAAHPEVDTVVAAIVGRAGLESTLAAVDAGKRVALANKETLVVAGPIVRGRMSASDAEVLPVDSEHSAIFQCIGREAAQVRRVILTASGGPFRTWTREQMEAATPESALAHPTWEMGPKITVDSATMMNKALEVIEARWLFDVPAEAIEVGGSPPVDHPLVGRIPRRIGDGPVEPARHADADPARVDVPAAAARHRGAAGPGRFLEFDVRPGRPRPFFRRSTSASRWPRPGGPPGQWSMRPTNRRSVYSWKVKFGLLTLCPPAERCWHTTPTSPIPRWTGC